MDYSSTMLCSFWYTPVCSLRDLRIVSTKRKSADPSTVIGSTFTVLWIILRRSVRISFTCTSRLNLRRKTHVVFYDVTNYHFEIDQEDDFRRKGLQHNTRNPLVQMGLLLMLMPITYRLFKGNTRQSNDDASIT